jgi:hypothetical protein
MEDMKAVQVLDMPYYRKESLAYVAEKRKQMATPKKNVEKTIISAVLAEPYRGRTSR